MSIINKMHQELQGSTEEAPILSSMPEKKRPQKVLLFTLISLLLMSAIGLSYLIYNKQYDNQHIKQITAVEITSPEVSIVSVSQPITEVQNLASLKPAIIQSVAISTTVVAVEKPAQTLTQINVKEDNKATVSTPSTNVKPAVKTTPLTVKNKPVKAKALQKNEPKKIKRSHLEIKTSVLTKQQLADIHLEKARKAISKGDTLLASQERRKALNLKPELHEVRQSLALYYYGIGEQNRASNVLKKGAVKFPEYSDFNLMLSRIALKEGNQQKAYLYLNQHPPKVEGHLDYHVSYAILSQKFENYAQSEVLYQGLLTQRPNNGRWTMSMAIAQDKQGKESLAVESYQKALLQVDLSSKAKKYINQRLTYLANQ